MNSRVSSSIGIGAAGSNASSAANTHQETASQHFQSSSHHSHHQPKDLNGDDVGAVLNGDDALSINGGAGSAGALMIIDNGDTSFEIDEPDDDDDDDVDAEVTDLMRRSLSKHHVMIDIVGPLTDDVIAHCNHSTDVDNDSNNNNNSNGGVSVNINGATTPNDNNTSAKRRYFIAAKANNRISLDEHDSTDSSISMSASVGTDASTTPTTADVADVVHAVAATASAADAHARRQELDSLSPLKNLVQQHHHQQQQQRHLLNNGSITDDNTSGSIATTTTEIDSNDGGGGGGGGVGLGGSGLGIAGITSSRSLRIIDVPPAVSSSLHHQPSERNVFPQIVPILSTEQTATGGHKRTLSASTASMRSLPPVMAVQPPSRMCEVLNWICFNFKNSGIGEPSVYHALVVIFLEFFSWGLLTMPVISVLNQTFPDHTFLMNGLVMGIKGILSFLSAPLVGALSDIWGRKFFLLITVFFTCAPIPLMTINTWWFFALISISGVFAVTFSVVFAYVADVTTVEERSRAYGLVSATFAASLVISPALGAILMELYSDTLVVALATAIAVLDVFFILVAVPESLPEKVRPASWGAPISWEQADPFAALRKVGTDHTILMQCVTVLLSYLPEAGQYSCIFVYLKLKMGFNAMEVAIFIAVVGVLSISVQVTLGYLMRVFGAKRTIVMGLLLEMVQLLWYGFGSQKWMMWGAGILAALGSVTYPAISAFVSIHSNADSQGAVQGMVTGMRGLCNGLGPAMFGVIFYLFNVDLTDDKLGKGGRPAANQTASPVTRYTQMMAGPPFVFGALMVLLAILVAIFIPEARGHVELTSVNSRAPSERKRSSLDGHRTSSGPLAPLMRSDSLAQL